MAAIIFLKRVYDPVEASDGFRILVDRLWPRGVSKDAARIDVWLKNVAPSPQLRQWFGHDPAKWGEFRSRYIQELCHNPDAIAQLTQYLQQGRVTLIYAARDKIHNHAAVLKDYLDNI